MDVSKIELFGQTLNIKDETAREEIRNKAISGYTIYNANELVDSYNLDDVIAYCKKNSINAVSLSPGEWALSGDIPSGFYIEKMPGAKITGTGVPEYMDGDNRAIYYKSVDNTETQQPLYLLRTSDFADDNGGYVHPNMLIRTHAKNINQQSYEWALLSIMENENLQGENVAVYGQANARADGPTWAACFEMHDYTGNAPAKEKIGVELTMAATDDDPNYQRIGVSVQNFGRCNTGRGMFFSGQNISYPGTGFKRVFDIANVDGQEIMHVEGCNYATGLNLAQANFADQAIAIGQNAFDFKSVRMKEEVLGSVTFRIDGTSVFSLFTNGRLFSVTSTGLSNVLGGPVGDAAHSLKIQIDGSDFYIPLYTK